jgi:hypothetical protein
MVAVDVGDALIASGQVPAPTLIKLDVEGHEAAVLRGLSAALADPRCKLVVFEDHVTEDSEVKRFLRTHGFIMEPLVRRERSAHALANFSASRK